ncbi:MAG: MerR family transcriptional regulator [Bacteroidetes bacterium]|nr:MerR family transcriptional regulator [Bacteroidota bacterium]MBK9671475.1 MerR family transcriptional regulator [Bacteroidota bacterium]
MPYKEIETVKLYYTMGEVAKMFDVNPSLIRFWEKEFDSIQPKKNKKGNRLFTAQDLDSFKQIYTLVKQKGFTLQGAKATLKKNSDEQIQQEKEVLLTKLESVKLKLLELQKHC